MFPHVVGMLNNTENELPQQQKFYVSSPEVFFQALDRKTT